MGAIIHKEHGVKVESELIGFDKLYLGVCSCGFRGPYRENNKQASADLGSHLADMWKQEMKCEDK